MEFGVMGGYIRTDATLRDIAREIKKELNRELRYDRDPFFFFFLFSFFFFFFLGIANVLVSPSLKMLV